MQPSEALLRDAIGTPIQVAGTVCHWCLFRSFSVHLCRSADTENIFMVAIFATSLLVVFSPLTSARLCFRPFLAQTLYLF